jgi:hypothetical protein
MIIFGWKAKEVAKDLLPDPCPHCGAQHQVRMHIVQKYAHIFWIPMFPLSKTGASQCGHCKQLLKTGEMPISLRAAYQASMAKAKTPLWTFTGLMIFAALIALGAFTGHENSKKNAEWISTPQAGDIYEVKIDRSHYTLYKVLRVEGDLVFCGQNRYETNKIVGLIDLKSKGNEAYLAVPISFRKGVLQQMLTDEKILNVDRK